MPRIIANHVRATPNVSCRLARLLMKHLLDGGKKCYPNGYTSHPSCRLHHYRCHARPAGGGVTKGRCVKGRRLVVGTAGP